MSSPDWFRAEGGSGDAARPDSASPPPASVAWAMAWAFCGLSSERALTSTTSRGVSSNRRLKPSGSTKRTDSSTACTSRDSPTAACITDTRRRRWSRERRRGLTGGRRARSGLGRGGRGLGVGDVDRQGQAGGGRGVLVLVLAALGGGGRLVVVQAGQQAGMHGQGQQVQAGDAHPHPGAAGQGLAAQG